MSKKKNAKKVNPDLKLIEPPKKEELEDENAKIAEQLFNLFISMGEDKQYTFENDMLEFTPWTEKEDDTKIMMYTITSKSNKDVEITFTKDCIDVVLKGEVIILNKDELISLSSNIVSYFMKYSGMVA